MEKIGIVAEFNPFHNGHLYFINQIKKLYPDSLIILVLNGYFLQRGETSILSKYDKTKIALKYKVDIILELPAIFGTQSADNFAKASIQILNYFKIDRIIFGSEENDINHLAKIAKKQINNNLTLEIKKYMNEGLNYPTALAKATNSNIATPNDLLGISYIKAILKINPNIKYQTIKRTNSYHDINSNDTIISASNIRNKLFNHEDITKYIPLKLEFKKVDYQLLFQLLKYKIITSDNLEEFLDVDEGIQNRLKKEILKVDNIDDFINLIKTKRYTYNKIRRLLIHILLSFKKDNNIINIEYIKILGFNSQGQEYINKIKKDINISLKQIKETNTYHLEKQATILYDILTRSNEFNNEQKNKPIINKQV